MARARNIKPGFFTNEDLVELDFGTRILFAGLWTLADREGRLEDRPKKIKIGVFPADNVDIEVMLQELNRCNFIKRYEANGEKYIQIVSWHKHQSPHHTEKASVIPSEDGSLTVKDRKDAGEPPKDDGGNPPDSLIPDSLIPKDPPNPPSQGGDGPDLPSADKPKRERKPAIALKTFLENCKESGEKAISEHKPLLTYVEDTGLPMEFVNLAWMEFKRRHLPEGPDERRLQADWRKHFVNCVTKGWYKLWYASADGGYALTTVGIQAQRLHDKREAA
ncbi:hypothetical protein [Achromobacter insuavis]|uniref:hypothetical protein n=1 Tax=Achromobacter insuavis TaxID=1287735 RepID=UPI001EEE5977|nr:hypothetical protein [Achromobacter insuavis]